MMSDLTITYITEDKYKELSDEQRRDNKFVYFVKGVNYNALYAKGRCYSKTVTDASNVALIKVKNEIELPSIGNPNYIYITEDGNIYFWSDERLVYDSASSDWEEIEWINGNGKERI